MFFCFCTVVVKETYFCSVCINPFPVVAFVWKNLKLVLQMCMKMIMADMVSTCVDVSSQLWILIGKHRTEMVICI